MLRLRWLILVLAAALVTAGMIAVACGGSSNGDDDTSDDASDDAGDDTSDDTGDDTADDTGDDTGDDDTGTGSFGGIVVDYLTSAPKVGATVELLNNTTGESFAPAISGTTGADGAISFTDVPAGETMVGVKVDTTSYTTTIQYDFAVGTADANILAVSNTTVALIAGSLGVTIDVTKGQVAGKVFWVPTTGSLEDVGCATVTSAPVDADIYYFGALLPDPTYTHTNPANSAFAVLNMTPGVVTLTSLVDGHTATNTLPKVYANSISITNVSYLEADYPTNPTPAGCTAGK
jgi:uncharacterized protein YunC (DUF1805 family)